MNVGSFALVGLGISLQVLAIVLCMRRAQHDGHSGLMWGMLAFFIWPVALLALVVIKPEPSAAPAGATAAQVAPVPLASPASVPAAQPSPAPAPDYDYVAPPDDPGMSVYTPFILNGVGLLVLFGLAQGNGDSLGALLVGMLLLMSANAGMGLRAFMKRESALAVCYFLVSSAGAALLFWVASGWGHR